MAIYAAKTIVSEEKSVGEIKKTIERYGAKSFGYMMNEQGVGVGFELKNRRLKFILPTTSKDTPQSKRTKFRNLLLCIKAKLASVDAGVETFEEAFLAQIVLPNGETFGRYSEPHLKLAYDSGEVPKLGFL